jgi:hypothetical protein
MASVYANPEQSRGQPGSGLVRRAFSALFDSQLSTWLSARFLAWPIAYASLPRRLTFPANSAPKKLRLGRYWLQLALADAFAADSAFFAEISCG